MGVEKLKVFRTSFIIMCIVFVLCMSGCVDNQRELTVDEPILLGELYAEFIDLGEKYLLELNYEQALVQFLKVIEIEPMNQRGYTGAAEAYVGLGDNESAVKVLKLGLERLPNDEEINQALNELTHISNEWTDWSVDDWVLGGISIFSSSAEDFAELLEAELRYEDDFFGFGPSTTLAINIRDDGYSHTGEYLNNLNQFWQISTSNTGVSGIGGITIGNTSIDEVIAMFPLPDEPAIFNEGGNGYASVGNEVGHYVWVYNSRVDFNSPEGYPDQLLFAAMVNSRLCNYSIGFNLGKVLHIWFEDIGLGEQIRSNNN